MKILILGSQGNLGAQLVKVFPEAIAWDRSDFDFLDFSLLRQKLAETKPDVIINAVAYNQVDKCEIEAADNELALKLNRDLVAVLAEEKALIVHYSTDYVFNGSPEKPSFLESDSPSPLNKYGDSKLAGEKALQMTAKNYYLIRTSKLFGPAGTSVFAKPNFFDIMLKLSASREEIEVVAEELSCFTYTPDLAQATKNLLESGVAGGVYHLVNPGEMTWYQAAVQLFKLKNSSIKIKAISSEALVRPARRPKYSVLLNTKLPALRPFPDALQAYLNYLASQSS